MITKWIEALRTDDPGRVRAAIAELVDRGTAQDWNHLVAGYPGKPGERHKSAWKGTLGTGTPAAREHTMLALLAAAPEGSNPAMIRARIEAVHIAGGHVDLTPLAAFPALRQVTVEHAGAVSGVEELIAAGRLTSLRLVGVPVARLDLSAAVLLERLDLVRLDRLTGVRGLPPSLRTLQLQYLPAGAAIDVSGAAGLADLWVYDAPLPAPAAALHGVVDLSVDQVDPVWLARLTGLRVLTVAPPGPDVAMVPLHLPGLTTLTLRGVASFTALAGGSLPAVRELEVRTNRPASLDGLGVLTGVTKAHIDMPELTDIGAAAAWTGLESLWLRNARITDLTPLAGLTGLHSLDLTGCASLRDLTPLAGLALRKLRLSKTATTRRSIPESLHPYVHPPGKVAARKSPAIRPAPAPAPPPSAARRSFAELKKMLLTRDPDELRYGIELMVSLGDPDLFEAFLSGAATGTGEPLEQRLRRQLTVGVPDLLPETFDEVVPNALLAHGRQMRPFREATIHALLGHAPDGSPTAVKLRTGLRNVFRDGGSTGYTYHPIDLAPLAELPGLVTLVVHNAATLLNRPALARSASLRTLVLSDVRDGDLAGLASPAVTDLVIPSFHELRGLDFDAFPAVRRLVGRPARTVDTIPGHLPALSVAWLDGQHAFRLIPALARSPLTALTLRNVAAPAAALAPLAGTPTLTRLDVRDTNLGDVTPLRDLRSLRGIALDTRHAPWNLPALAQLPRLEELVLDGFTLSEPDLRALADVPTLRRFALGRAMKLEGPLPATLQKILERTP